MITIAAYILDWDWKDGEHFVEMTEQIYAQMLELDEYCTEDAQYPYFVAIAIRQAKACGLVK